MIYHITTSQAWEQAQAAGVYGADSLASEGFIHCSTAAQVEGTANRFFHGCQDLLLLHIDDSLLIKAIKYENLEGGETLFPHIYSAIPLAAIRVVQKLPPNQDGSFAVNISE